MPSRSKKAFPRIGRTLPPAAVPFSAGEILQGLRGCLRPRREMARFETELKDYFQVRHCFPVSSGKTALYLLLRALQQLRPGRDEVIIPAYTCFSVPSAIVRAGLKITLCDIDTRTLDFDFTCLEALLNRAETAGRLLCVLPTHLYGLPADIGRLQELLRAKDLADVPVIEDAAQAMGAADQAGGKLGTLGDAGFFSLGRGKAFSLVEGGLIVTDRNDLARALAPLVAHLKSPSAPELCRMMAMTVALTVLIRPTWFWLPKALPWLKLGETVFDPGFASRRMSAFQTGLARGWQAKLKRLQSMRARQAAGWANCLPRNIGQYPTGQGNLIRLPVRVGSNQVREEILAQSDRCGLGAMPGYPTPLSGIAALRDRLGPGHSVPNAARLAAELLTLPLHRFVTEKDRLLLTALFAGEQQPGQKEAFSLARPKRSENG